MIFQSFNWSFKKLFLPTILKKSSAASQWSLIVQHQSSLVARTKCFEKLTWHSQSVKSNENVQVQKISSTHLTSLVREWKFTSRLRIVIRQQLGTSKNAVNGITHKHRGHIEPREKRSGSTGCSSNAAWDRLNLDFAQTRGIAWQTHMCTCRISFTLAFFFHQAPESNIACNRQWKSRRKKSLQK